MLVAVVVTMALGAAATTMTGAIVRIVTVAAPVAIGDFGAACAVALIGIVGVSRAHNAAGQGAKRDDRHQGAHKLSHCSTLSVSIRAHHAHRIHLQGEMQYMWETFPCQVDVAYIPT